MKLNKHQIEEINKSIKLSINYQDIRSELVDHLASKIEQKMEENEISFEKTLETQLSKLNLDKFQKQVLLNHHLSSFKKLYKGWLVPENAGLAILVSCLTYFLISIGSIEAGQTYTSFITVMAIVYSAPFVHGLFKKQMRQHSEFMSNINSLFFLCLFKSFSFDLILEYSHLPKPIFMSLFMGMFIGQLIIGIKMVNKTYDKMKFANS